MSRETPFQSFAQLCESLEATTKRNEKKRLIANFLKTLGKNEVQPTVAFLTAKAFPESEEGVLEVGGRTLGKNHEWS